jgi:hypothetical protein
VKMFIVGLTLVAALVACGGGATSPVAPSTIAPASYTSKIVYLGALVGAQADLALRDRSNDVIHAYQTGSTPAPIMVTQPFYQGQTFATGGTVEALVSPLPSSTPQVTFSNTNTTTNIQTVSTTPAPNGSTPQPFPTGVVAEAVVSGSSVMTQSSGTATANVGAPVNQAPSVPIYSYAGLAFDCTNASGYGYGIAGGEYTQDFGFQWNGSAWVPDNDPTTADVYIDGPSCEMMGSSNTSESGITMHIPGGDTRISTDTSYNTVSATQWQNAGTSFQLSLCLQLNADGSNDCLVVGKTRSGAIFKLWPNNVGFGYYGAIEVSGSSVDGF